MEQLTQDVLACLRDMHEEATTVRNGLRTGLVDYAGHKGRDNPPWEVPIYTALGEHLAARGYCVETDVRYSSASRHECDLVIRRADGLVCWTEMKLVWKDWISTATGARKTGGVDSYITGGAGRSHSLAHDFGKLEQVLATLGSHVQVVALGFDATGNQLDGLIEGVERAEDLKGRGWRRDGHQVLVDHNSRSHRIGLWSWSKAISSPPLEQEPVPARTVTPQEVLRWIEDYADFEARAEVSLRKYTSLDSSQWYWEDWVAECMQLHRDDLLVHQLGELVRQDEAPYRRDNYYSSTRVERVIASLHNQATKLLRRQAASD